MLNLSNKIVENYDELQIIASLNLKEKTFILNFTKDGNCLLSVRMTKENKRALVGFLNAVCRDLENFSEEEDYTDD